MSEGNHRALMQHMGPGLLGAPGAPARAPAKVDPAHLWRDEAARVLHLNPPQILLGSHAKGQPMSREAAVACHPAQWLGAGGRGAL